MKRKWWKFYDWFKWNCNKSVTELKLKENYYKNGEIKSQQWVLNGEYHNEDSPAYVEYYENGQIEYQIWYLNGKRHNENGPAVIIYDKDGGIDGEWWHLNGIRFINEEEFKRYKLIKELAGIK